MDFSLPTGVEAEKESDSMGGGPVDSAVYKGVIDMVYLSAFPSGAQKVNIHFKHDNRITRYDVCISTGKKADGNVRYTYKGKNGDVPLPGYSQINSFFRAATGQDIAKQTTQLKTIKIYDFSKKEEVPTEVTVFTDCIGKEMAIGILKYREEGTRKESVDSSHAPYSEGTGKYYTKNSFDKYFDANSGLTVVEKQAGATEPAQLNKWKERNAGSFETIHAEHSDKEATASNGASAGTPAPKTDSLFT